MRKPQRQGYQPSPGFKTRPVDTWREWAAVPLPVLKVSSSVRPPGPGPFDPVYTLEEDGAVIGTWRHSDVPWLRPWLSKRLGQLHGAMHVARVELGAVAKKTKAAKDAARDRATVAKERDKRIKKAAQDVLADQGEMPYTQLADYLADRDGFPAPSTLVKKLPKLLKRRK